MPHVLIPDSVDQKAIDLLSKCEELVVSYPGKLSQEQLLAQVPTTNAMIIRSGVTITAEIIAAASNLKAIARAGVGVDNVDLDAATAHGVVVMNTPGGNTISTAEHTFGLMLALARFIPQGHATLKEGRWDRKNFTGVELKGKTLGLLGFGRIGQAMAKRALAFEMDVLAYDPFTPEAVYTAIGAKRAASPEEIYAAADFISLHSPALPETKGMINAKTIAQMKDGVRIVNAARGVLIDDNALAEALKAGKVAGAALDVYVEEPPAADHPLLGLPNVIHTPHLAASTSDAQITVAVEAAELIANALIYGKFENVVNTAVLEKLAL